MNKDPDLEIVSECQSVDQEVVDRAYKELFERYKDKVFNVALRVTGNSTDAADIAQETFITIYKKIGEFRFDSKFSSWLYRIVVNLSIDRKRKNASRYASSTETLESLQGLGARELIDNKNLSPDQLVGMREFEGIVQGCINQLSTKFSTVLVLRYIEDLSYKEIGDILHCSIGTVKSRLNRAHKALEMLLGPWLQKILT